MAVAGIRCEGSFAGWKGDVLELVAEGLNAKVGLAVGNV